MKNFTILSLFAFFLSCNFGIYAQVLYSEDFSKDPNYTSLSPTKAYWDETNENYYVKTFDNLQDKYWAYSPKFTTADATKNITIKLDMLCENADWGTYPGMHFYNSEPTDISNESRTLSVRFTWSDNNYKKISIGSTSDKGTASYKSSASFENNKWYTVEINYYAATNKADIKVTEKTSGSIFYQETNVDFYLSDFSYLALGYYNQPNYGNEWSPIRLDNVQISGNESTGNEATEHLYPVFKYHLIQDGTRGIKVGMTMLSLFNVVSSQTILEAFEEALLMGLEHTRDILLDDLVPSAKYITGCVKYSNDNSAITNADIEYILETKNEIKIGIPFSAELTKFDSDMGSNSDLIPPKVSTIINDSYTKDEPIADFKTVYEAGYKMSAALGQSFSFSTIGVVNNYIHINGKNFLLLHNFDIANVFDSDGINFKYIPVDISNIDELPKKGSLIKLKGYTEKLDFIIRQEYAYYGSEKVYQYLIPTEFEIIKGESTNSPVYNSPVFYQYINDNENFEWGEPVSNITSIIAVSLNSEKINTPDFCFKDNRVDILPQGFIRSGNYYTVNATLLNQGDIEGDCVIRAFAEIANNRIEISKTKINSFKPGEEKDITFNWNPNKPEDILLHPSKVYFTITKTSPFENRTTNNSSFKEFHFFKNVDHKTSFIVTSYCPVTLKVTSPEGHIIDIENSTINGAEYIIDDFDGNNSIDNRIVLPELVEGTYKIEVLPKENAKTDDTYTLKIVTNNVESTLADSVKINEIPVNHYTHVYTSSNLIENDTKVKMWLQNDELIIKCNDYNSNKFLVEIIDISGKTLYKNYHEMKGNNPIRINTPSIRGANIVRISNKNIAETCLIVRPK